MAEEKTPLENYAINFLATRCVANMPIAQQDIDAVSVGVGIPQGESTVNLNDVRDQCYNILESAARATEAKGGLYQEPRVEVYEGGKAPVVIRSDYLEKLSEEQKAELGSGAPPRSRRSRQSLGERGDDFNDKAGGVPERAEDLIAGNVPAFMAEDQGNAFTQEVTLNTALKV